MLILFQHRHFMSTVELGNNNNNNNKFSVQFKWVENFSWKQNGDFVGKYSRQICGWFGKYRLWIHRFCLQFTGVQKRNVSANHDFEWLWHQQNWQVLKKTFLSFFLNIEFWTFPACVWSNWFYWSNPGLASPLWT